MQVIVLLGLLAASSALSEESITTNNGTVLTVLPVVPAVPIGQSTVRPVQTQTMGSSEEMNLRPVQTTIVGATVPPSSSPSSDLQSTMGSDSLSQLTTAVTPSEQTTFMPENDTDILTTTFSSTSNTELPQDKGRTFVSGFAAATGEDGRIYYVKNVNGKVERGVLKGRGQLPIFDMNQAILRYFDHPPFYYPGMMYQSPNFDLGWEIRNAVNEYLQNLRI